MIPLWATKIIRNLFKTKLRIFLLPQICPNWYDYSLFFLNLAHEINHKLSHYEESFYSLFRIAL